jgi:hypothetical protein
METRGSCGRTGRLTPSKDAVRLVFGFLSCNYLRLFAVNERKELVCAFWLDSRFNGGVPLESIPVHTSGTGSRLFVNVQPHGDNDARSHPSASDFD